MGRESRLPRDPNALTPYGEAFHIRQAQLAFVYAIRHDLRVDEWRVAWASRQAQQASAGVTDVAERYRRTLARIEQPAPHEDLLDLSGLLFQRMGIPETWLWAPIWLLAVIQRDAADAVDPSGADARKIRLVETGFKDSPSGRMPRHQGKEIVRNVNWWYRHHIKDPTDSIHALAKEYVQDLKPKVNRSEDARSVVQDGLKRAETLLNGEIRKKEPTDSH